MRTIKAVILAAGLGSRLSQAEWPKAIMPIGSYSYNDESQVSFLTRQIRLLRLAGVQEIAVVLGHKRAEIAVQLQHLDVHQIVNTVEDIGQSGSLHSFQFACLSAFNPLDGESHTLLIDADIVYEFSVLDRFIHHLNDDSSLLVTPNTEEDSEEVRVYGYHNRPQFIGKGLTKLLTNGAECLGEATGMVHLAPKDHTLAMNLIHWLCGNPLRPVDTLDFRGFGPAKQRTEHEEMSQRLMTLGKLHSIFLDKDMLFMEVDFIKEYETCIKEIYPNILKTDYQKYPQFF